MKFSKWSCLVFALCAGCSVSTSYITRDGAQMEAVNPQEVKIYASVPTSIEFEVVGLVCVEGIGNADGAKKILVEEAASMGADAVIDVRLTKMHSFADRTGLSGIAVRVVDGTAKMPPPSSEDNGMSVKVTNQHQGEEQETATEQPAVQDASSESSQDSDADSNAEVAP